MNSDDEILLLGRINRKLREVLGDGGGYEHTPQNLVDFRKLAQTLFNMIEKQGVGHSSEDILRLARNLQQLDDNQPGKGWHSAKDMGEALSSGLTNPPQPAALCRNPFKSLKL
jgi:hypothetical protein